MSPEPWVSEAADPEGYRGPQVCQLVGITYRQLDYWARTNLVRPSVADAKGSGSSRRYSVDDIAVLRMIRRVLDTGAGVTTVRAIVPAFYEAARTPSAGWVVLADGEATIVARDDLRHLVETLIASGGIATVLDVTHLTGRGRHHTAAEVQDRVVSVVVDHFGITADDLLSEGRQRPIAEARQIAMWIVRDLTGISYPQIGELFDRDHSTVIHGCRHITGEVTSGTDLGRAAYELRELARILTTAAPTGHAHDGAA